MKIFDFDGTLVDSNGVWAELDRTFLGQFGLRPTREYIDLMGHSTFAPAAQITRDYYHLPLTPEEIMARWTELIGDAYRCRVPMKAGARAYLEHCRLAGERMVLFTSCVREFCQAALERLQLEQYFEAVLFSEDLGVQKRDPASYPAILAPLGCRPEECTFFEDSPGACSAARQAGLRVIGVLDPFYAPYEADLRRICHRCIRSFEELLDQALCIY